ncbi:MAG: hypothetical protein ACXQS9_00945 [Methermicoccaceae archaeon]
MLSKFVDTAGLSETSTFYSQFQDLINRTGGVLSLLYVIGIGVSTSILTILAYRRR